MTGFLPEKPGVIKMDVIPEIRRLHFVENVTISDLAKQFKLSRPTIRKHLKTIEEPVYPPRQHQPHLKLGDFIEQLTTWLETDAALPGKKRKRTAQRLYECLQVEGYIGGYSAVQRYVKAWKASRSASPCTRFAHRVSGYERLFASQSDVHARFRGSLARCRNCPTACWTITLGP
ncbi:ArsR family transcriptional regulator [Methylomonas fluvii]|uniref:ArsR family transcriptional regulator n=1 Tax=Methylomonas fluvii TaxID=1854564 RepID=UPI001A0076A7|nr:HTH domain-containing protein [Methylomonas fluvii]CAD6872202.1 Transposase [Methylomonas fluvii]